MSIPGLLYHGTMLSDRVRNDCLARAVAAVVEPGDVVIDVGAGTGFLSMLAARAGARRVYALEWGPIALVAERSVEGSEWADVVSVERVASHDWEPPERADVILCETLGFAVLDERFRPTLADARDRMLAPGGRLLPREVDIVAAPVSTVDHGIDPSYIDTLYDLDLSALGELYRALYRRAHVPLEDELGEPRSVLHLDCHTMEAQPSLRTTTAFTVRRSGVVNGFALWFRATLADGIELDSRRPTPDNHWGQTLLPLFPPIEAREGDVIELRLLLDDRKRFRLEWAAERAGS